MILTGIKNDYSKPVVTKPPISPDLAREIIGSLLEKGLDQMLLIELQQEATFMVMYFLCARFEEAVNLTMKNIGLSLAGYL